MAFLPFLKYDMGMRMTDVDDDVAKKGSCPTIVLTRFEDDEVVIVVVVRVCI